MKLKNLDMCYNLKANKSRHMYVYYSAQGVILLTTNCKHCLPQNHMIGRLKIFKNPFVTVKRTIVKLLIFQA